MTVGSKPTKTDKRDDDELFPEGPTKKTPERASKPKTERREKTEKAAVEAPKKAARPEPEPPRKPSPAPAPAEVVKPDKPDKVAPAPAQPSPSGTGARKLLLAGAALVAVLGVSVFAATQLWERPGGTTTASSGIKPQIPIHSVNPQPSMAPVVFTKPSSSPVVQVPAPGKTPTKFAERPKAPPPTLPHKGKPLSELAGRSANHGAIARTLEAFDAVRKVDLRSDDRLFEDYRTKQKREAELIDQIRQLGPSAIAAMKDMITELDDPGYRLLVTKALAGMKDPDALKASADLLANVHDLALQTTLVRFLPDGADTNTLLAQDYTTEQNPNVRGMLLREYAHRVGDPDINNATPGTPLSPMDDSARQVFRQAALNDPDSSVRAEAVQIIGRRGDPQDMDFMAQIAQNEPNLQIRQAAIISYALTGQNQSLPVLGQLAQSQDSQVEVRASAVLAIARVAGQDPAARDQALQMLDSIAQNDGSDQIRSRAQHFASSLRSNTAVPQRTLGTQPIPYNPRGH
jgi:hypothetical protein